MWLFLQVVSEAAYTIALVKLTPPKPGRPPFPERLQADIVRELKFKFQVTCFPRQLCLMQEAKAADHRRIQILGRIGQIRKFNQPSR
jgi:hypothetical protein